MTNRGTYNVTAANKAGNVGWMGRTGKGGVGLSRELAWSYVQEYQANANVNHVIVRRDGEVVWTWVRP